MIPYLAVRSVSEGVVSLISGKHGQIQDLLVVSIFVIVLIIGSIVAIRLLGDINNEFQQTDALSDQAKDTVSSFNSRFSGVMDGVIVFAIVMLSILLVVSVFFVETHPVFFVVLVPLFLATIIVNALLINIVDDLGSTSALFSVWYGLTMTNFLAQHWVALIVVQGFLVLIAFFSKKTGAVGA